MKVMQAMRYGGPEVLEAGEAPMPQPGEYDLLVEVKACGLNPVDTKIRRGYIAPDRPCPLVLGFDVSGVVAGFGSSVDGFKVGDEVYASPNLMRPGANAQFVCVDSRTAVPKPRTLDHVHAAAMPLALLTAWEALYDRCRIRAGQTVLIHAGGGGVGHLAIQLAKLRGCRVLTTASSVESIALAERCGADVIINHKSQDVLARVKELTHNVGCPVVFDTVGDKVFDLSLQCVALNGQVVTILGSDSSRVAPELFRKNATLHYEFMGVPTIHNVNPEHQGDILRQAGALVDDGKLKPHVSRVFKLSELVEAHQAQESGRTVGKMVLTWK
jgi:NADPH2:quinone reductase